MSQEIAAIQLSIKAVTLSPARPYTYSSGIKSPVYCDNRRILSYPAERSKINNGYTEAAAKAEKFDVVGGIATAGIPWASWLAAQYDKPLIYIRDKPKGHGRENQIEGDLQPGQRVLLIEDLVSTGKSSVAAVHAVRAAGGIVTDCISIFSYGLASAAAAFQEARCALHPLCTLDTLLGVAIEQRYITPAERDMVLAWQRNPDQWQPS